MSETPAKPRTELIASAEPLERLTDQIGSARVLALDTEFVRERTFFPDLCLIQVATADAIGAVDCLAGIALSDFFAALGAGKRPWVLHSSSQDLEILTQTDVKLPDELIDTQIAAALLGMSPQIGYAQLVEELLAVGLDKSHTRTDWRRRPIRPAALRYAMDDVRYLLPLWQRLKESLQQRGRLEWFVEDCATLLERYGANHDEQRWRRVKGIRSLDQTSQSVARELSAWREELAARINRPRQWLLSDAALIALARGQPTSERDLGSGYELPARFRARHGKPLLAAIARGQDQAGQHRTLTSTSLSQAERKELKALGQAVKRQAQALGLATEILATRQEMTNWIRGDGAGRLAHGWRAEMMLQITR